jgi:hypothetical protein
MGGHAIPRAFPGPAIQNSGIALEKTAVLMDFSHRQGNMPLQRQGEI